MIDVDEYFTSLNDCEQMCINLPGSCKCNCGKGFRTFDKGKTCEDIDECKTFISLCRFSCENTLGSYKCNCPKGMKLHNHVKSCIGNL